MNFREPQTPDMVEVVEKIRETETLPSPAGSTALIPLRTLADVAADIRRSHSEYEASVCRAADKATETGRLLNELKARVRKEFGHGYWEAYVAETFPFTMRTAQNYMRLANHKPLTGQENERDFRFLKRRKAAKIIGVVEQQPKKQTAK